MKTPRVWMFSGQGSQYYRMGADLYDKDAVFRDTIDACSAHLEHSIGISLSSLLFRESRDRFAPFDRTLYSHPALFSVQLGLARSLWARHLRPDLLLGYSLGEWVAYTLAGAIPATLALDILVDQARTLELAGASGAMLAVLDSPALLHRSPECFEHTSVAAINYARHFVITGPIAAIETAEQRLRAHGSTVQRLPVSHAFHSSSLDPLRMRSAAAWNTALVSPPRLRLFSARGVDVSYADPADALWRAVRDPIDLPRTLACTEALGLPVYVDCGPSGTLSTFVKYNLSGASTDRCIALMSPFDGNLQRIEALQIREEAG